MWRDLHEVAAWPPQTTVALGDFGTWNGNVFVRAGNVNELPGDIPALTEIEEPQAQNFFSSSDVNTVTFAAGAKFQWPTGSTNTILTGGASVQVTFSSQNSVWANFGNCRVVELLNKFALMNELLRRARDLSSDDPLWWDHAKYRVVTQIVRADRFTIALSRSNNAGLVVEANVDGADWGSANLSTKVSHQSGALATWDGVPSSGQPYTPQFRTSHVVVLGPGIHKWVDDDGPRD
jgi:hypothetical protein